MKIDVWFLLLCISLILITALGIYISLMRNKKQIHYAFLGIIFSVFIWSSGNFLLEINNFSNMLYVYFYFFGVCFLPVSLTFLGLIFAYTKIDFNWKYKLLFIFPIIDYGIIITNKYHHLFFVKYSSINTLTEYGKFYFTHTIISYIYIFIGIAYLLYYSIKNAGFFSKQSLLIIIGICIPFVCNIFENFHVIILPIFINPVAFSFGIICFAFAIFKFDFLNIVPIALQRVVDLISDSYVVLNENLEIIDYNKTLIETFESIVKIKRKDNFISILKENDLFSEDVEAFDALIKKSLKNKKSVSAEKHVVYNDFDKHFTIEITPIFSKESLIGIIILFKDITQHKMDLELIEKTHNQLLLRERLASLGEVAGGVAHDINSPLSAVQSGLFFINMVIENTKKEIADKGSLTDKLESDYESIQKSLDDCNSACTKISKIVNSVRNHTRNLGGENVQDFNVGSVIDDLKILLNHQLKSSKCELVSIEEDKSIIKGDPGKLGQVLTNLIVNAIQAYGERAGVIEIKVAKKGGKELISIRDEAGGIPEQFRNGIFKNILTTKGTEGTGLGLYLSYSIITGNFGGEMWFETEEGKGTAFYISIPIDKKVA